MFLIFSQILLEGFASFSFLIWDRGVGRGRFIGEGRNYK